MVDRLGFFRSLLTATEDDLQGEIPEPRGSTPPPGIPAPKGPADGRGNSEVPGEAARSVSPMDLTQCPQRSLRRGARAPSSLKHQASQEEPHLTHHATAQHSPFPAR